MTQIYFQRYDGWSMYRLIPFWHTHLIPQSWYRSHIHHWPLDRETRPVQNALLKRKWWRSSHLFKASLFKFFKTPLLSQWFIQRKMTTVHHSGWKFCWTLHGGGLVAMVISESYGSAMRCLLTYCTSHCTANIQSRDVSGISAVINMTYELQARHILM